MSDTITKFNVKVQTKIKQVEARFETLKASGVAEAEHADNGIRSHFTTLEASAYKAKRSLDYAVGHDLVFRAIACSRGEYL